MCLFGGIIFMAIMYEALERLGVPIVQIWKRQCEKVTDTKTFNPGSQYQETEGRLRHWTTTNMTRDAHPQKTCTNNVCTKPQKHKKGARPQPLAHRVQHGVQVLVAKPSKPTPAFTCP